MTVIVTFRNGRTRTFPDATHITGYGSHLVIDYGDHWCYIVANRNGAIEVMA